MVFHCFLIYAFQACDHFLNFSISQVTDTFADKPKEIQRRIFVVPMELLHDEPDGVYLISLNQKYRPIQVLESDSFKIFGKVIGKCKGAEIPGFH